MQAVPIAVRMPSGKCFTLIRCDRSHLTGGLSRSTSNYRPISAWCLPLTFQMPSIADFVQGTGSTGIDCIRDRRTPFARVLRTSIGRRSILQLCR